MQIVLDIFPPFLMIYRGIAGKMLLKQAWGGVATRIAGVITATVVLLHNPIELH